MFGSSIPQLQSILVFLVVCSWRIPSRFKKASNLEEVYSSPLSLCNTFSLLPHSFSTRVVHCWKYLKTLSLCLRTYIHVKRVQSSIKVRKYAAPHIVQAFNFPHTSLWTRSSGSAACLNSLTWNGVFLCLPPTRLTTNTNFCRVTRVKTTYQVVMSQYLEVLHIQMPITSVPQGILHFLLYDICLGISLIVKVVQTSQSRSFRNHSVLCIENLTAIFIKLSYFALFCCLGHT